MLRNVSAFAATAAVSVSALHVSSGNVSYAEWSSWFPSWPNDAKSSDGISHISKSVVPGALFVWGGPGFGRSPRSVPEVPPVQHVAIFDEVCAAVASDGSVYVVEPSSGIATGDENRTRSARSSAPGLSVMKLEQTGLSGVKDVAMRGDKEIVLVGTSGAVSVVRRELSSGNWEAGTVLAGAMRRARIDKVRCGEQHCVAIANDGVTYTWGRNSHGQCGSGSAKVSADHHEPVQVQLPIGVGILDADCGDRHTCFLSKSGVLYGSGDDHWMQLGITAEPWIKGERKSAGDVHVASCVEDVAVDSVSCGAQHTFLVARDGTPWSFGENSFGQLGHHNIVSFAPPNPIAKFDLRAVLARAGRSHTCVLSEDGRVLCIGEGTSGQLGSGPLQRSAVWRAAKKLASAEGVVVALAAGGNSSAALVARTNTN